MRSISFIISLSLLPLPSYAATGGVFCKGTMSFIARPDITGALDFKIEGSDPRQHLIQIGGSALPHAGGWRYQIKSDSKPEDRCTLDIKEIGTGYSVKSFEGARCESAGGYGAYEILMDASFPAGSRVIGAVPPSGKPDGFADYDCDHKRYFPSDAQAASSAAHVIGAAPIGVARGLVMQDTGGWSKIFDNKPTALMRQYFTDGFNRSWAKAMTHNQDEPVLDADPITGYQTVTRVEEVTTTGGETGPDAARVVAKLKVTAGGQTQPEQVTFDLKLEHQHWKIDDITSGAMPSVRTYFRKSYGA